MSSRKSQRDTSTLRQNFCPTFNTIHDQKEMNADPSQIMTPSHLLPMDSFNKGDANHSKNRDSENAHLSDGFPFAANVPQNTQENIMGKVSRLSSASIHGESTDSASKGMRFIHEIPPSSVARIHSNHLPMSMTSMSSDSDTNLKDTYASDCISVSLDSQMWNCPPLSQSGPDQESRPPLSSSRPYSKRTRPMRSQNVSVQGHDSFPPPGAPLSASGDISSPSVDMLSQCSSSHLSSSSREEGEVQMLINAAAKNDLETITTILSPRRVDTTEGDEQPFDEEDVDHEDALLRNRGVTLRNRKGQSEAMQQRYLLVYPDPNRCDYDRRSPLHLAASEGHVPAVQLLVERFRADVSVQDRFGYTPLDDAIRHWHTEVVDYLVLYGARLGRRSDAENVLVQSVKVGQDAMVSMLLRCKLSPNTVDHSGRSLLQLAVRSGDSRCVELLLAHNANPLYSTNNTLSSVAEAERAIMLRKPGSQGVLRLLQKAGFLRKRKCRFNSFNVTFLLIQSVLLLLFYLCVVNPREDAAGFYNHNNNMYYGITYDGSIVGGDVVVSEHTLARLQSQRPAAVGGGREADGADTQLPTAMHGVLDMPGPTRVNGVPRPLLTHSLSPLSASPSLSGASFAPSTLSPSASVPLSTLTEASPSAFVFSSYLYELHVLIVIGFSYLLLFLRKHKVAYLGYIVLCMALATQVYILASGLWSNFFYVSLPALTSHLGISWVLPVHAHVPDAALPSIDHVYMGRDIFLQRVEAYRASAMQAHAQSLAWAHGHGDGHGDAHGAPMQHSLTSPGAGAGADIDIDMGAGVGSVDTHSRTVMAAAPDAARANTDDTHVASSTIPHASTHAAAGPGAGMAATDLSSSLPVPAQPFSIPPAFVAPSQLIWPLNKLADIIYPLLFSSPLRWLDLPRYSRVPLTLTRLIQGDFATSSLLVSLSIVLSRTSSFQLLFVTLLHVLVFSFNENLLMFLRVGDIGGSIFVHLFGAVFGLSMSLFMDVLAGTKDEKTPHGGASTGGAVTRNEGYSFESVVRYMRKREKSTDEQGKPFSVPMNHLYEYSSEFIDVVGVNPALTLTQASTSASAPREHSPKRGDIAPMSKGRDAGASREDMSRESVLVLQDQLQRPATAVATTATPPVDGEGVPPRSRRSKSKEVPMRPENTTIPTDVWSIVATVFLWLFWPFINSVLASSPQQRRRSTLNTILAMSGSCIGSFFTTHLLRGVAYSVHNIQIATLAGGVAIGASADIPIPAVCAIAVGLLAGSSAVMGYLYLQPYIARKFGIVDSCGLNNLHLLPSLIGVAATVLLTLPVSLEKHGLDTILYVFPAMGEGCTKVVDPMLVHHVHSQRQSQLGYHGIPTEDGLSSVVVCNGSERSARVQALIQLVGALVTIVVGVIGGWLTAIVISSPPPLIANNYHSYIIDAEARERYYKDAATSNTTADAEESSSLLHSDDKLATQPSNAPVGASGRAKRALVKLMRLPQRWFPHMRHNPFDFLASEHVGWAVDEESAR